MSLVLSPQTETILRTEAAREGISVDDLIRRTFGPPEASPSPTDDPDRERVLARLRELQREYGLPERPDGKGHTSVAELFEQWRLEDEKLTPEEIEAERRFWAEYESGRDRQGVSI